jgi:hypothetical protein
MTTLTAPTAHPTKLRNGSWGATVKTATHLDAGDSITITTKTGKTWTAEIAKVVWRGSQEGLHVLIVATRSTPRSTNPDRCRTCHGRGRYDGCDRCGAESQTI